MSDSNGERPGPDDPLPPELDPRRGRRRHSRRRSEPAPVVTTSSGAAVWAGRGAKVLAATLSIVVLVGSGVLWGWYRDFNAKVTHVAGAIPDEKKDPDQPGRGQAPDVDGESQNILLVGDDSRAGLTEEQLKEVGTEADPSYNTDTILLVHIPANGESASAVSFPRDSWVYIPVLEGEGKINSAYVNGMCDGQAGCNPDPKDPDQQRKGIRSLTETVSQLAGVKIDHYVQIGLWGFYNMTKALGGVEVCLKEPQKEPLSGIDLPAGRQTIEGTQAMAFVRQRHGIPGGDLGRIKRQQAFLGAITDKVISAEWLLKPWKLQNFFDEAAESLTVDEDLDIRDLAAQLRGIAAGDIEFTTVPVANENYTTPTGASAVQLDESKLPAFFAKFMGKDEPDEDEPESKPKPTVPRDQVQVAVYNGSGASGVAGQTQSELNAAGFNVTEIGDAASFDHTQSEIHYAAGAEAQANTLAKVIPGAKLIADDSVGSGVQLILGSEFDGVQEGGTTEESPDPADAPTTEVRKADDDSCVY